MTPAKHPRAGLPTRVALAGVALAACAAARVAPVVPARTALPPPPTPLPLRTCIDEPPLPAEPTPPAEPDAAPSSEAARICARVRARNAAWPRARAGWAHLEASQWCRATPAGAWATVVEASGVGREGAAVGPRIIVRLQWIPTEEQAPARGAAFAVLDARVYFDEVRALAVFDWDGDGLPELALLRTRHRTEAHHSSAVVIVTARGGRVAPYAAAPADIQGVADLDGDGRPDLELSPGLGVRVPCDGGVEHGGPARVALSLPDGSFTEAHPAARAYVRRQCRGFGDDGALLSPDDGRSVMGVACARYRGAPAEAVAARVRAEYPGRNDGLPAADRGRSRDACLSLEALLRLARAAAPFTLGPPCPERDGALADGLRRGPTAGCGRPPSHGGHRRRRAPGGRG